MRVQIYNIDMTHNIFSGSGTAPLWDISVHTRANNSQASWVFTAQLLLDINYGTLYSVLQSDHSSVHSALGKPQIFFSFFLVVRPLRP